MDYYELDAEKVADELQTALARLLKRKSVVFQQAPNADDMAVLYSCLEDVVVVLANVCVHQAAGGLTVPVKVVNTIEEALS